MLAAKRRLRVAPVPLRRVGPPRAGFASAGSGPLRALSLRPPMPGQRQETAPEGEDAGTGPADPRAAKDQDHGLQKRADTTQDHARPSARPPAHHLRTGERTCPHAGLADNLSRTFGLEPVDYAAIREAHRGARRPLPPRRCVDDLNEKAMQIHLQRGGRQLRLLRLRRRQFYSNKVTRRRDHHGIPERRPRRGPRRRRGVREQGRARPPLRRPDGPAGLRADGRGGRRGLRPTRTSPGRKTWKPYEPPAPRPAPAIPGQSAAAEAPPSAVTPRRGPQAPAASPPPEGTEDKEQKPTPPGPCNRCRELLEPPHRPAHRQQPHALLRKDRGAAPGAEAG